MDEITEVSAAYALRLAADLLSGLVVRGVLTKGDASTLIDDGLAEMLASLPSHEQHLRKIAAALTAQVELARIEADRLRRKPPSPHDQS